LRAEEAITPVWIDPCEDEYVKVHDMPYFYRFATGLDASQMGIRAGIRNKSMFIDTVAGGNANAKGLYGVNGGEAAKFGKTFLDALIEQTGQPDVWLGCPTFKVESVPADAVMAPRVAVWQIGSQMVIDYPELWKYNHWGGWSLSLDYMQADEGVRKSGDLILNIGHAEGQWVDQYGQWVVDVGDYVIAHGLPVGEPHRVVFRISYTDNPRIAVTLKEIYVDDSLVLSPNLLIADRTDTPTRGGYGLGYVLGHGYYHDAWGPYGHKDWHITGSCYSSWCVDDVVVWTGAKYYDYPWKAVVIPIPWWVWVLGPTAAGSSLIASSHPRR